jgi:hypothetical protein
MVGGHGNPGDGNTSFGPWQLHSGGALPSNIGALGPVAAQQWAWSTDGINYALADMARKMNAGAGPNLTGRAAVDAMSRFFEISNDIPGQAQRAWDTYTGWLGTNIPITLDGFFNVQQANGQRSQVAGGADVQDGQGNAIVPVPPTALNKPTTTSPATGGAATPQDVRLGTVGPFNVGIPSGLVLGLLGLSLLLIGALLFAYGGQFRASVNSVGGSVRRRGGMGRRVPDMGSWYRGFDAGRESAAAS